MPQLDTLTYFSQFFWFIIIFLSLYIILSNDIIPIIATNLKTRNKIVKSGSFTSSITNNKIEMEVKILNNLKN